LLTDAVGMLPCDVEIVLAADPAVPAAVAGERSDVVVYAPLDRADDLGHIVTALGDLEVPVTIIARDAPTIGGRVRFELPGHAAAALGRARVIVDASRNDPGAALALAKLGRPLVVSSAGGAAEVLHGAGTYDPWHRRSTSPRSQMRSAQRRRPAHGPLDGTARERAQPAFAAGTPLVSVVVATHNRPVLLGETLAAIERQTYPALEIIVVNDAGTDVRDVVAQFPRARLLDQPENRGPAAARNRGLADANGAFVILFDDDDEMFPITSRARERPAGQRPRCGLRTMINTFVTRPARTGISSTRFAGHDALPRSRHHGPARSRPPR